MSNHYRCITCGELASAPDAVCRYCGHRAGEAARHEEKYAETKVLRKPNATENALMASAKLMEKTALYKTGMLYAEGIGVGKNLEVAKYLLCEAAQKGSPEAMYAYSQLIKDNKPEEAQKWLSRAAKCGSPEAKNLLSDNENIGFGQPENQTKIPEAPGSLKEVVEMVSPFCVEITSSSSSASAASGSGCLIGANTIITNAHVVVDDKTELPHKSVVINFYKSMHAERRALRVVAFDRREDVALCSFADARESVMCNFPKLADARMLKAGDGVFTIGNALGQGLALSAGVVSKEVEADAYGKSEVLQTDISINGGNSGGPLFDYRGNVVGLMTFTPVNANASQAYGVSFAVTSGTIAKLLKKWE